MGGCCTITEPIIINETAINFIVVGYIMIKVKILTIFSFILRNIWWYTDWVLVVVWDDSKVPDTVTVSDKLCRGSCSCENRHRGEPKCAENVAKAWENSTESVGKGCRGGSKMVCVGWSWYRWRSVTVIGRSLIEFRDKRKSSLEFRYRVKEIYWVARNVVQICYCTK